MTILSGESLVELEVPFLTLTVTEKGWVLSAFGVNEGKIKLKRLNVTLEVGGLEEKLETLFW